MKLKFAIILLAGVLFTSCGGNSPEAVVKDFFAAIEAKDFTKAKSLATSESSTMIDMMEKAIGMVDGLDSDEESKSISKVECEIEGEKGDCKCWTEGNDDPEKIAVKKEEGTWKVHMSKKSMMNDAMEGIGDVDMEGAMDKLKGVDMAKAMEAVSESLAGVENLDEQLNELTDELKAKAVDVIDAVEENLDEVKENLTE